MFFKKKDNIEKKQIRKLYNRIRLEEKNRNIKEKEISKRIIDLDIFKEAKVVALYFGKGSELNTDILIKECFKQEKIVCFPKVIDDSNMKFYKVSSIYDLALGKFDIMEPTTEEIINSKDIDLMIIPGVAFDKKLNRLGYGKGYYDHYMKNNTYIKVGICFESQIAFYIPVDKHDIKMDMVITEKNIYK